MNRRTTIPTLALCLLAMTSCFTGIESTPRITADDVRHAGVGVTPEQRFGMAISAEKPSDWSVGKQWMVDDNKIAIIFNPPTTDTLSGQVLSLVEISSSPTVMGETAVELVFGDSLGHRYSYQPGVTVKDFGTRQSLSIPFAVELSAVEMADSMMRGKTYYIKTPLWRDASGRRAAAGLRHVPVTVAGIAPGTPMHPLRVMFTTAGDSQLHSVLLSYGDSKTANRNFDRVFSFTDPRLEYPDITDAVWNLIIHSKVCEGMNRDECRLALGAPTNLRRGATDAAHIEHWSYDDGTYLIFEDGILTRFRK